MKWNRSGAEDDVQVNDGYHEPPKEGAWMLRITFGRGVPQTYDDFCRHVSTDVFDCIGNHMRAYNAPRDVYEVWWRSSDDCKRSWYHVISHRRHLQSYRIQQ